MDFVRYFSAFRKYASYHRWGRAQVTSHIQYTYRQFRYAPVGAYTEISFCSNTQDFVLLLILMVPE